MTKDLHTKLRENNIPHYELLLYRGKELEKRKEQAVREKEKLEIEYERKLQERKPSPRPPSYTRNSQIIDICTDDAGVNNSDDRLFNDSDLLKNDTNFGIFQEESHEDTFSSRCDNMKQVPIPPPIAQQRYPLLYVDINLGNNKIDRITIFEGKFSFNFVTFCRRQYRQSCQRVLPAT